MDNSVAVSPEPRNEPIYSYLPNSPERKELKRNLYEMLGSEIDIPLVVNGKEVRTGQTEPCVVPHDHSKRLGVYHKAGPKEIQSAIETSLVAWKEWSAMSGESRASVFLRAAELLTGKYRYILNAATMLGQSKTCYQAEIDSACEMIDFFRFNVHLAEQIYRIQPLSALGQWNRLQYRPLEGFIFAVTPFNFTAIAGNLTTSAALMGNVAIWKPASTSVYSGYFIMKLLMEAGLPPGVIQFVPGPGSVVGNTVLQSPHLAGIHFTGSTSVFHGMWNTVGERIQTYRNYPRIVGETGGKDFVFAHASADLDVLTTALIRGAFEYQGQKCSAASRAYIPKSIWPKVKERLVEGVRSIKMGDVLDFRNFMSAVIDKNSWNNIHNYIESARKDKAASLLVGGECSDERGYFVRPTVIETTDPKYRTMCEEIFGPVLTIHPYEDEDFEEMLRVCDETSPYALTGAILSQDRSAIEIATRALTHSAGNFYINNKPTGAVVGQQPFGGSRASGTNDKAGSLFNLLRWVSVRTISETFVPPKSYPYPFMDAE